MTDSLRDRIKEEVLDGILSMFSENDPVEMAAGYIADAVIAELGLRREEGAYDGFFGRKERHRYITEWKNDD